MIDRLVDHAVSCLLLGDVDPQHSTEDRVATATGMRIEGRLVPA
jgi:hypothetical protein